jgi:hypothetical protein
LSGLSLYAAAHAERRGTKCAAPRNRKVIRLTPTGRFARPQQANTFTTSCTPSAKETALMGKMTFLAGAGVGYVLGARAGREKYDKIQEFAKTTAARPEVEQVMEKAAPLAEKVKTMAADKIPGIGGDKAESAGSESATSGSGTSTSSGSSSSGSSSSGSSSSGSGSSGSTGSGSGAGGTGTTSGSIPAPAGAGSSGNKPAHANGATTQADTAGKSGTVGKAGTATASSGAGGTADRSSEGSAKIPPRGTFSPTHGTF